MKKNAITLIVIIGMAINANAQIPNSGFEDWTNMSTYTNPNNWGTMNNTTAAASIFTATKGTPGSPGSFYLKLTSKSINSVVVNGVAVSGVIDSIAQTAKSGFPFTARPQSFTGKWQHMIFGSSQGSISALLTRWNSISGERDTIATLNLTLTGMAMSWANFSIDFIYQSGNNPDTCVIVLKPSGANPSQEDYLWVDNLAFSGSVAGITESPDQIFSLNTFPNPANNEMEFNYSKPFNNGDRIIISDILGNEILNKGLVENSFKINTSAYANGTYIYKLVSSLGVNFITGKFAIQH